MKVATMQILEDLTLTVSEEQPAFTVLPKMAQNNDYDIDLSGSFFMVRVKT